MAMNDGRLPPMTPVPEKATDVIDPAFTIGYGALMEDTELGLQCPVRGCGRWFHQLGLHVARSHQDIGGLGVVRDKLSIPQSARLISQKMHDRLSSQAKATLVVGNLGAVRAANARSHRKSTQSRRAATLTIGMKNLRDSCPTQLAHKIIDLHHKLGRTPSGREANAILGQHFTSAVIAVYGTWNNCIAQCGLETRRKASRYTVENVLPGLSAYYEMHGTLPYCSTVKYGQLAPLLPCATSILRAFDTDSWPEAMRRAASWLNIYGGKYGLPIQHAPKMELIA